MILTVISWPVLGQEEALPPEAQAFLDQLSPQTGAIEIPDASATLELGEEFLFYGPKDAESILTLAWGNPPEISVGVLGLVMPEGTTPFSDTWGAVITYEETGYVSDEDASEADYAALMRDIQSGAQESNEERASQGYPQLEVVGWAKSPQYDNATHSVIWAQEIAFSDSEVSTLNYDIRTLGRKGVLSLNLISTMPQLDEIELAAADFAKHARFNPGARYEDFDPSVDDEAGYGIAGLVAGGVGLAAAKKLGIFAIFLKFLKPILIGLLVLLGAFGARFRGLFRRKQEDEEWEEYQAQEGENPDPLEEPEDANQSDTR